MLRSSVSRETAEAMISKAKLMGISDKDCEGDLDDVDFRRDVTICLLRKMYDVLESKLNLALIETEHIYDTSYQTFHDATEPARNVEKLSSILMEDIENGRAIDPEIVRVVNSSARYILLMIDDLRELMVLRKRRSEEMVSFCLSDVVCEAADHLRSEIDSRNAVVNVDGKFPVILSNRSRWVRIFVNLIKNGISYNDSERPEVTVEYSHNIVSVADNGLGIPASQRERVFGLFERMSDREHMSEGTGSGLYQVAKLLSDENASVSLKSDIGEGSVFSIDVSNLV